MEVKDQVNKRICSVDHQSEGLTGVFPSKQNSLIRDRSHTVTGSTCIRPKLDTKGVKCSSKSKGSSLSRGHSSYSFTENSTSISSNKNYSENTCQGTSVSYGYDLFVKYRHVYAGTGNWFKRTPSYKYTYPTRGNTATSRQRETSGKDAGNKQHAHRREIMRKLARNLQLKSKGFSPTYNINGHLPYKRDKVHINCTQLISDKDKDCLVENELEVTKRGDDLKCSNGKNNGNICNCNMNSNIKVKATQCCNTKDNSSLFLKKGNRNPITSQIDIETNGVKKNLTASKIDCTDHEKDATFNHSHSIDKCNTSMKASPHNKFINQSVAMQASHMDCKRTAQDVHRKSEQNSSIVKKGNSQDVKLPTSRVSTRNGMKMFSRLSLEARTAMDEAKKDGSNSRDSNKMIQSNLYQQRPFVDISSDESIEEIRDNKTGTNEAEHSDEEEDESHTKQCNEVRKITDGKIRCCCPYEQKKHFVTMSRERKHDAEKDKSNSRPSQNSKHLVRSVSVGNEIGRKHPGLFRRSETTSSLHKQKIEGDGKDHLRTLTRNNKHTHANKNAMPHKVVPIRELDKEGTFVITPMGYDSRFADRPVMLDVDDETPQEVIKSAIQKCNDWLFKHT